MAENNEQIGALFADIPEALETTLEIASKVEEYSIDHAPIMPNFAIPEDFGTEEEYRSRITEQELYEEFTRNEHGEVVMDEAAGKKQIERLGGYDKLYRIKFEADYLKKITYEGAARRYGTPLDEEVNNRILFELHVMKTMGFPGYFLIVQDFIKAGRELGVSIGPGRGSAAGSVVAYCVWESRRSTRLNTTFFSNAFSIRTVYPSPISMSISMMTDARPCSIT